MSAKEGAVHETRPVTSLDVARLANVSQSTVSRAFSENTRLSKETRQRVLEAAQWLGYRPNAIARSMVSGHTNIIGLIVMRNSSPFYSHLVNMVVTTCREMGYCAMMIRQIEGESGADTVMRALEYRVDGVVITAIEDSESACEICRQASVPIVLLNRHIEAAGVDSVCCDNYRASQEIADYLVQKGHRTVACLMGEAAASTTRERLRGITSRAAAGGLQILHVAHGDYTYESGEQMCRRMMESGSPLPDAVFCSADIIAFGVMDTLRYQYGLRIPEDISVIGFDDTTEAAWVSYNLTTMRQPYQELVNTACEMLLHRIEGRSDAAIRTQHTASLMERGSVCEIKK